MRSLKKYFRAGARVLTTKIRLGFGSFIHHGKLIFKLDTCLALTDIVDISSLGFLSFGRGFRTRGHCLFNIQEEGRLLFGSNVFLNSGCQFNCRRAIQVGSGCEFGPNVLVYDHDHQYRGGLKNESFLYGDVSIGRDCWIGAGTIILRGSQIGNGCVIAAGSIVKGIIPSQSLVLQKRKTEIRGISLQKAVGDDC